MIHTAGIAKLINEGSMDAIGHAAIAGCHCLIIQINHTNSRGRREKISMASLKNVV